MIKSIGIASVTGGSIALISGSASARDSHADWESDQSGEICWYAGAWLESYSYEDNSEYVHQFRNSVYLVGKDALSGWCNEAWNKSTAYTRMTASEGVNDVSATWYGASSGGDDQHNEASSSVTPPSASELDGARSQIAYRVCPSPKDNDVMADHFRYGGSVDSYAGDGIRISYNYYLSDDVWCNAHQDRINVITGEKSEFSIVMGGESSNGVKPEIQFLINTNGTDRSIEKHPYGGRDENCEY